MLKLNIIVRVFQILDEVEKRRAISPALVQPFMRGIMEAPFPAPGRTITVKNFLPGAGTEVKGWVLLCNTVFWKNQPENRTRLMFPTGDRAVQAVRFSSGACGLWMPLFLPESTTPSPGVCLAASGAQGDLHCWQTQVGSGIMLSQIAVAHLLSRPRHQTFCGVSVAFWLIHLNNPPRWDILWMSCHTENTTKGRI